jgi:DNA repair exonuclease SbcCD nuclease subunit
MWAPGVTIDEFKQTYLPAIENGGIQHMALYTLTDEAERDDHCGNIYHKSILYLVSNALEEKRQTPLLGLAKDVRADKQVSAVFKDSRHDWVLAPNKAAENSIRASRASKHGEFDDEKLTVKSTLARILQAEHAEQDFEFSRTSASLQDMRKQVERIN